MSLLATPPPTPPISALFLIEFDAKAGYTLLWKRAASDSIVLDDVVEYKSLPSGLHEVDEDLVYFVHDAGFAGLSAFVNRRIDDAALRNARMVAVGVLVPLSYGRLGRAWRHTADLQLLARQIADDKSQIHLLEEFWSSHSIPAVETSAAAADIYSHSRLRAVSDGTRIFAPPHRSATSGTCAAGPAPPSAKLEKNHPAHGLTRLLETFGPLVFPLFRAALLRKRILISCHAPVHQANDFVYDLSILSNIPSSLLDILPESAPTQRLRPLFTVGVRDIPLLAADLKPLLANTVDDSGTGWIACTTDSILAIKEDLWDVLVTLPTNYSSPTSNSAASINKPWPTIKGPKGLVIKATQRDLRRYTCLKAALARLATPSQPPSPTLSSAHSILDRPTAAVAPAEVSDMQIAEIVEPVTWTALAYQGFMWWASAGEQRHSDSLDEAAADAALLADLIAPCPVPTIRYRDECPAEAEAPAAAQQGHVEDGNDDEAIEARTELAIVAYFHRLTTQILSVGAQISSSEAPVLDSDSDAGLAYHDDDDDEEEEEEEDTQQLLRAADGDERQAKTIRVGSQVLEAMGLDIWSSVDAEFARAVMRVYFERRAHVETKGVEVCGVRLC
ncbi:hypothetical protein TD95_000764 [Thielaviopsis punctulata]|uniref:DUF4484 domain-containing protein n=1 Tax=Thielaviopsis punctulata TaxID=72032 RepID=A0A0F4Z9K3_9PEZI|nr:hypothetical protein TD95_000764 [Thielaviopsis punctulata]